MSIRLLADENCHAALVAELRANSFDVRYVREESPGLDDASIMALASADGRVLLTHDRDVPRLVFAEGHLAVGVVYIRVTLLSPEAMIMRVLQILSAPETSPLGRLIVVEDERTRMRTLPGPDVPIAPRGPLG